MHKKMITKDMKRFALIYLLFCIMMSSCTTLMQKKVTYTKSKTKTETPKTETNPKTETTSKTETNTKTETGKDTKDSEAYSKKLGIKIDNKDDQKLIKSVSDWIGTPYLYAGSTKKGADCSGFVQQVYIEVYDKLLSRTADGMYDQSKKLKKEELKQGDLVFFKIETPKVGHVGIYLKDGYFAHASSARGVMVNHLDETYYKKYFYAGGKMK